MGTKQQPKGVLSTTGQQALDHFECHLRNKVDLSMATIRGYVGDVRLFMIWCEESWVQGQELLQLFSPEQISTLTLTRYRDYLQHELGREPATVNRYLISVKKYFTWATEKGMILHNPAQEVQLIKETPHPPRRLSDQEEKNLIAAVKTSGTLRDRTIIIFMLHTGLRVSEVCHLKLKHVILRQHRGQVKVWGKRNKYREVPLNITVRKVLQEYLNTRSTESDYLFLSQRTKDKLTQRAIGFIIHKYVQQAGISNLQPRDLRTSFWLSDG